MIRITACVAACCGMASASLADELWRQDPIQAIGGFSSQDARNPGGLGWFSEVIDNFTVSGMPTVSNIEFWGGYAAVVPGTFRGCTIRFYTDNAGQPGPRIFEQDVLGTCGETPDYTTPQGSRYHYSATLNPPFVPPSPGLYWMSVVAIVDRGGGAPDPQWGWVQTQTVTPPAAIQYVLGSQLVINADVSFVVNGTPGPVCYPNCDDSTVAPILNVLDFICFLNRFNDQDPYANCDNSTVAPVLNVLDFICYLNRFNDGCR
jgi:hypothetical protein